MIIPGTEHQPGRRRALRVLTLAGAAAAVPAIAQERFPSRPITLVVPLSAGGPTDVLARRFGQVLSQALRNPVVVANVPGAGGTIGTRRVMDAAPDGYTALVANTALTSAPTVLRKPELDPRGKLEPIGLFASTPVTVTVRNGLASNLQEFIRLAREKGEALNMAHSGEGSGGHLNSLLFNSLAKINPTFVPYQGAGQILTALAAGLVDVQLGLTSTDAAFHKGGRARILAVSSRARLPALPDVPTMAEAGLPAFDATTWFGLLLPKGVPAEVLAAYEKAMAMVMADASYLAAIENDFLGERPAPGLETRAGFARYIESEIARWRSVLADKGAPAAR